MIITIDLSHVLDKDQFDSLETSVGELATAQPPSTCSSLKDTRSWTSQDINSYLLDHRALVHAIRLLLANMRLARINIDKLLGEGVLMSLIVKDVATQMLGSPPEPEVCERYTHFEERLQAVVVRAHFNRQRDG